MEDVVYLKNGSIIRGIIIEQVPNQSIIIQTKDRNIFVFKYEEIDKMTKENLPTENSNNNSKVTEFKKNGFINLIEINYSPGIGEVKVGNVTFKNYDYIFSFRTVNGYQLNEHFSLGISIGIDKYKYATLLPITFDARATILKGQVSPVFTANVGYAVGQNVKAGLLINPQIGIKNYISKNVAYFLNIGYKWQAQEVIYYTFTYPYYYNSKTEKVYFEFITISTGFAF
jgi:sRNA-binding regulator protein Hfq